MNRQIPTPDKALSALLRSMQDDIKKLSQGSAFAGRVSFGEEIMIGKISITTSGDSVMFTNQADGKTATITLT